MGLIKAFAGAIGGTFADQWLDFYSMPANVSPTAAFVFAEPQGQNNGRGSNTKGSVGIISNGSKILVPEGWGLITMQDSAVTGFTNEAGGYVWDSNDVNSTNFFGDGFGKGFINLFQQSWNRFKFGGQPGAQQMALLVNLKEIPNNRFGTQSEIYWDDSFLGTQVGALARGSYTLQIIDPILFLKQYVPATYLTPGGTIFDFADMNNPAGEQLFNEVVGSLAQAFSLYTNDPTQGNRMTKIQSDQIGFASSLSDAVEQNYQWTTDRGLKIVKVAIQAIEYDEDTKALLSDAKKADALGGNRAASFTNQAVARGMQSAGENGGGAMGIGMMGMAAGMTGATTVMGQAQSQNQPQQTATNDPTEELTKLKGLVDAGVITQEDFDAKKKQILGL